MDHLEDEQKHIIERTVDDRSYWSRI